MPMWSGGSKYYRAGMSLEEYKRNWRKEHQKARDKEDGVQERVEASKERRWAESGYRPLPKETSGASALGVEATIDEMWSQELKEIKPKATDHKSMITTWVIYWPFSAAISLMEDLVREAVKWVVTKLRAVYDAITDAAMKDVR
jgi:hypothetical protein